MNLDFDPGETTAGARPRRRRRRSIATLCALAAVAMLALPACGSDDPEASGDTNPSSDAPTTELRKITVVHPSSSAIFFFPLAVAIGQGYFEDEGLDVKLEVVDGAGASLQAVEAGQAQFGVAPTGPLLNANNKGAELVGVYHMNTRGLFAIAVPDDSDVKSLEDLEGATIGVGTAEGGEVSFSRSLLTAAGLEEGTDYSFQTVGDGGSAVAGFERNEIDAYAGSITDIAVTNSTGFTVRDITPEELPVPPFAATYTVTRDFLEEDADVVEGFGRALAKATTFGLANPEVALEDAKALNPEEASNEDLAHALFDIVAERIVPLGEDTRWGYVPPESYEAWQQIMLDSGELPAALPDLTVVYSNDLVDAYNAS